MAFLADTHIACFTLYCEMWIVSVFIVASDINRVHCSASDVRFKALTNRSTSRYLMHCGGSKVFGKPHFFDI